MNGRYKCGAPSCGRAFDSSGALLRHRPSCLSYQQQAAMQVNFRRKRLQNNTGRDSVAFKKRKLQENVRESMVVILTLSHLKDNRRTTRQNPIRPALSQLWYYRHHALLSHLNALTMPSCWMLVPVRLWLWSIDHYCTMFVKLSRPLWHYLIYDSRKMRQWNPIFSTALQLHHHRHCSALKIVLLSWTLALFKLWIQRVCRQCRISWDISLIDPLTMNCRARRLRSPGPFKTITHTI